MLHRRPGIVPARVGVGGRYFWDLLDELGRPDPAATRRAGGGRWRKNLITDYGLKAMFTEAPTSPSPPRYWFRTADTGSGGTVRPYLVLGDGSTPPDPADVALESYVANTSSNGGFGGALDTTYAEDGDDIVFTATQTRVYTAPSDVIVREWGYSVSSNGTNVSVRELFRDDADVPVSVSILATRKLRHTHALEVRVPKVQAVAFDLEEYDVGGALVGTTPLSGVLTFHAAGSGAWQVLDFKNDYQQTVKAYAYTARPVAPAWNAQTPTTNRIGITASFGAATGTTTREIAAVMTEVQANGTPLYGFALTPHDPSAGGWLLTLDEPHSITKDDTKTLRIGLDLTFARA